MAPPEPHECLSVPARVVRRPRQGRAPARQVAEALSVIRLRSFSAARQARFIWAGRSFAGPVPFPFPPVLAPRSLRPGLLSSFCLGFPAREQKDRLLVFKEKDDERAQQGSRRLVSSAVECVRPSAPIHPRVTDPPHRFWA